MGRPPKKAKSFQIVSESENLLAEIIEIYAEQVEQMRGLELDGEGFRRLNAIAKSTVEINKLARENALQSLVKKLPDNVLEAAVLQLGEGKGEDVKPD